MKTMPKIVLGVLVLACVFGAIYYFTQSGRHAGGSFASPSSALSSDQPILLYVESGDVSYKTTPDGQLIKATTSPTEIPNKTTVHTDNGKASVLLPSNSSFSIGANTEVVINYTQTKTSLFQNFGSTYHRVEALTSGQSYEVQTPGTLAAVRGTKFAVNYNPTTKKTKVAVTEHTVDVMRLNVPAGGASSTNELVMTEGKTAVVVNAESGAPSPVNGGMSTITTANDGEMSTWVGSNRQEDAALDKIKEDAKKSNVDLRTEMRKVLFNDSGDHKEVESAPGKDEDTPSPNSPVVPPTKATTDTNPVINIVAPKVVAPTVRIDDDTYFSKFNDMFVMYFYLDDTDSTCSVRLSPTERVAKVTAYAVDNGRPITSTSLLSFAQAIDAYCTTKDPSVKAKLQARFDDEFPYKDNT
jgi:hypothetical protein